MNALLCNLGNSRLQLALCGDGLSAHATRACEATADYAALFRALFGAYRDAHDARPETVWLASVRADATTATVAAAAREVFDAETRIAEVRFAAFDMDSAYDETLIGVDRFLAIIGAQVSEKTGAKGCAVVDCGTATTVDFIDARGRHLGGFILPGVAMMRASLAAGTDRLPVVDADTDVDRDAAPRDTQAAIARGCDAALRYAVEGLIDERGDGCEVLVTGGDAKRVLRDGWRERPYLVLEGLARYARSVGESAS